MLTSSRGGRRRYAGPMSQRHKGAVHRGPGPPRWSTAGPLEPTARIGPSESGGHGRRGWGTGTAQSRPDRATARGGTRPDGHRWRDRRRAAAREAVKGGGKRREGGGGSTYRAPDSCKWHHGELHGGEMAAAPAGRRCRRRFGGFCRWRGAAENDGRQWRHGVELTLTWRRGLRQRLGPTERWPRCVGARWSWWWRPHGVAVARVAAVTGRRRMKWAVFRLWRGKTELRTGCGKARRWWRHSSAVARAAGSGDRSSTASSGAQARRCEHDFWRGEARELGETRERRCREHFIGLEGSARGRKRQKVPTKWGGDVGDVGLHRRHFLGVVEDVDGVVPTRLDASTGAGGGQIWRRRRGGRRLWAWS